jgi:integrase/recombinase XerD
MKSMAGDTWNDVIKEFESFLMVERSLSENSIEAYLHDVSLLANFAEEELNNKLPSNIAFEDLKAFIQWLKIENPRTQARILSGVRSFFRYMLIEGKIEENPASLIESPRLGRVLPEVLSEEEIDSIISSIDLSKKEGQRNKAIIEMLYGCGLRVSELINLKLTDLHLQEEYLRVTGKGDKQRLVPLNRVIIKEVNYYFEDRNSLNTIIDKNILFLNRRGRKLTREMIYTIIKNLATLAGIDKKVSPHTFRHSFATHLIKEGADLRAVQEMLGHESILTTEIYTHIDRLYLRQTLEKHHPRSGK